MKKNKIQTDNVEQLMEIVRAIQRGEEPTQESIRENTERVSEADVSEPGEGKAADASAPSSELETDWDDDDEFERILASDGGDWTAGHEKADRIRGQAPNLLSKVKGFFVSKKKDEPSAVEESEREDVSSAPEESEREDVSIAPETFESRNAPSAPEESESEKKPSVPKEPEDVELMSEMAEVTAEPKKKGSGRVGLLRRDSILRDPEDGDYEEMKVDPESRNVFERIAGVQAEQEVPAEEAAERDSAPADSEDSSSAKQGDAPKVKKRKWKTAAEKEEEIRKGFAPQRKTAADYLNAGKEAFLGALSGLREKGISRRELTMIGAVILLVVLIAAMLVQMVSGSISTKRKSEHVTADEGLRVTVEDEPENWSSSYPVQLRFSVRNEQIVQISLNGVACEPDENGMVTFETGDYLLEAEVRTDQGTRSARIEIPKLDGDAPVVRASLKDQKIELTAVDARSTVRGLYYAAYYESSWNGVPQYQIYTEPITYTEGMVYSFYAEDAAGNCSTPVVTTMETAQELTLSSEELSLYPGETAEVMAIAEPAGALLNNLQYESMNPELISVSSSGKVTGLAEGTGTVKVSAEGISDALCTVTVANSRTVTLSALGDCTLGTDEGFNTTTNFNAFDAVNGHGYFFKNVKSILEADDVTFANLEGTFTTETVRENKQFAFKGDPSYTEILQMGSVEVVTLANNHSSDYGAKSLTDTQNALTDAEIAYCIGDTVALKEINGIKTAFIGIFVTDTATAEAQVRETVADAKSQGAVLTVIAFHWGTEKASEPDQSMQSLAHTAIDCGADLVVGHHPHVLQRIEKYNGKYIAYSLGNFCFGGNSAPSDMDTIIFQQTFTVGKDGVVSDDAVTVIPCSISSADGYNNYQPTPAEGEAKAAILERLNGLCAGYGVALGADGTVLDGTFN